MLTTIFIEVVVINSKAKLSKILLSRKMPEKQQTPQVAAFFWWFGLYLWNPEFSRMQDLTSPRAWYSISWDRSKWSSHEWNEIVSVWEQIPKCGCSNVQLNSPWPLRKRWHGHLRSKKMVESSSEKTIEITMRLHDYCRPGKFSRDSCHVARRLQCFVYKRLNHGSLLDWQ